MSSYFRTVVDATMDAVGALVDAAKVIGPATVDATKIAVRDINFWADDVNARLVKAGVPLQSSGDVPLDLPEGAPVRTAQLPEVVEAAATAPVQGEQRQLGVSDFAYPLAMMALMNYVSRCDEELAAEEAALMQAALDSFCAIPHTPELVKVQLRGICAKEDLSFQVMEAYLDGVSDADLSDISKVFQAAARADGVIKPQEELVQSELEAYLQKRMGVA